MRALLECRGITGDDAIEASLAWEPVDLERQILPASGIKGFDRAVEILLSAREKHETVVVHGDYDVDGMTGTALLWLSLRRAGINAIHTRGVRWVAGR